MQSYDASSNLSYDADVDAVLDALAAHLEEHLDIDKILEIAASCYELTGLGYLGVDIVLDKTQGPLMLELNARPGLNIQIANREGVLGRYQAIEAQASHGKESVEARIQFSKTQFQRD